MEAIILGVLLLVVGAKGGTAHQISKKEAAIREVQGEEAEVSERLQSTETALRQLEQEKKGLDQEYKHLTEKPEQTDSRAQRCEELSRQIEALKGRPQRRFTAAKRYETECQDVR